MKRIVVSVAALIAIGCAPPNLGPAYGPHPEMSYPVAKAKVVKDKVIELMVRDGFTIKRSDEYSVMLAKSMDGLGDTLLFGSRYDSTPEMRVTYSIFATGENVTWRATVTATTNPGSAFERTQPLPDNHGAYRSVSHYLSEPKSQILRLML